MKKLSKLFSINSHIENEFSFVKNLSVPYDFDCACLYFSMALIREQKALDKEAEAMAKRKNFMAEVRKAEADFNEQIRVVESSLQDQQQGEMIKVFPFLTALSHFQLNFAICKKNLKTTSFILLLALLYC